MEAPLHNKEDERLSVLASAHILDTDVDHRFDAITDLLRELCNCPVVLVSLVDSNRQWFKSATGVDICETPRDQSICAHAILQDDLFIVPDTWKDERTVDNPLCVPDRAEDRPFRFYAGMPLVGQNDLPLGTLCILDYKPRELSEEQKKLIRVMAKQTEALIELNRYIEAQEILHNEMDHRVKNSLQSVLSLIRLYSNLAERDAELGAAGREAFDAIKRRVESIALLHEALHKSKSAEKIKLAPFLKNVIELLQGSAPTNITIRSKFSGMTVSSKVATSVAIIISEFCANSIKHGFEGRDGGDVFCTASKLKSGDIVIHCEDNGIGKSVLGDEDRKIGNNKVEGLGIRLMEASASQIGGIMTRGPIETGYQLKLTVPSSQGG